MCTYFQSFVLMRKFQSSESTNKLLNIQRAYFSFILKAGFEKMAGHMPWLVHM